MLYRQKNERPIKSETGTDGDGDVNVTEQWDLCSEKHASKTC